MICYKDRTFCNGGTPLCAKFLGCPKALTPEVAAAAKKIGLPIMQFMAPTSMPCYAKPGTIKLPKETQKQEKERKKVFDPSSISDEKWTTLFVQEPRRIDREIAELVGCSTKTVQRVRIRLGITAVRPPGVTRHTKYTEDDALRLIHAHRDGDKSLWDAAKRAGIWKNVYKHLLRRFRSTFDAHGF